MHKEGAREARQREMASRLPAPSRRLETASAPSLERVPFCWVHGPRRRIHPGLDYTGMDIFPSQVILKA